MGNFSGHDSSEKPPSKRSPLAARVTRLEAGRGIGFLAGLSKEEQELNLKSGLEEAGHLGNHWASLLDLSCSTTAAPTMSLCQTWFPPWSPEKRKPPFFAPLCNFRWDFPTKLSIPLFSGVLTRTWEERILEFQGKRMRFTAVVKT